MGDNTGGGGGRGTQAVIYIPGGRGRAGEVVGVVSPRAGQSIADAVAGSGINTRGARVFPYQPVGGRRLREGDFDLTDLGSAAQLARGSQPATRAGLGRLASAFPQAGRQASGARRSAQAAARQGVLAEQNRLRARVLRATRGQSDRRRQTALRNAGLPGSALRAPLTIDQINRGRVRG